MPKYINWGPGAVKAAEDDKPVEVGGTVQLTEEQAAGVRQAGIYLQDAREADAPSSGHHTTRSEREASHRS